MVPVDTRPRRYCLPTWLNSIAVAIVLYFVFYLLALRAEILLIYLVSAYASLLSKYSVIDCHRSCAFARH